MDLFLIERDGNGGDLVLLGNDIATVNGYENIPYLSMFSGADWWGNEFLEPAQRIGCKTEIALRSNALNSAGRVEIEKAIADDLAVITENLTGVKTTLSTAIVSDNRLSIEITVNGEKFAYMWNPNTAILTVV